MYFSGWSEFSHSLRTSLPVKSYAAVPAFAFPTAATEVPLDL